MGLKLDHECNGFVVSQSASLLSSCWPGVQVCVPDPLICMWTFDREGLVDFIIQKRSMAVHLSSTPQTVVVEMLLFSSFSP